MNKNKKGIQLNQAFGAVLTVLLIAILVIIGVYLFSNLGTTFTETSGTQYLESGWINSSGYPLSNRTLCNYNTPSITAIENATDGTLIQSANYTLIGNVLYNSTTVSAISRYNAVLINSTYKWGAGACTATNSMISNFSGYPTLIGLVGTIVFLGLVIGVLVASFVFGRKEGA